MGDGKVFILAVGEIAFDRFLVGFAVGAGLHGDHGEVGKGDEIEVIFVGPLDDEAIGIVHKSASMNSFFKSREAFTIRTMVSRSEYTR